MKRIYELLIFGIKVITVEGWGKFWEKLNVWRNEIEARRASEKLVFSNLKPISSNITNLKNTYKTGRPHCVAISMVKNEGDIIVAWLSHVADIFDAVYIVDHNSSDGTREYILEVAKSLNNIHVFTFNNAGKYQREIVNRLVNIAVADYPETWIFPLDADEFLCTQAKEVFLSSMDKIQKDKILRMCWKMCLPAQMENDVEFVYSSPCLIHKNLGTMSKVAVHSSNFLDKKLRFIQGNHAVINQAGEKEQNLLDFTELLHLPYRSIDHFALKCVQNYLAHEALPPWRKNPLEGFHHLESIKIINNLGTVNSDILRAIIKNYSNREKMNIEELRVNQITVSEWISSHISVPHLDLPANEYRCKKYIDVMNDLIKVNPRPELIKFLDIVEKGRLMPKATS